MLGGRYDGVAAHQAAAGGQRQVGAGAQRDGQVAGALGRCVGGDNTEGSCK